MNSPSIKFKNKDLFGNTFDAYHIKSNGHLLEMILDGRIDKDGYVKSGSLSELWSYVYMLYMNNRKYDVFDQMRGRLGKLQERATAKRFIRTVLDYTHAEKITEDVLKSFINDVIKTKSPVNPILSLVGRKAFTPKTTTSPPQKHSEFIEKLVKLSHAKDADDIENRIRELQRESRMLQQVKSMLGKEVGQPHENDIYKLIELIKAQLHRVQEEKKEQDTQCIDALKLLKSNMYGKMCLVKYIGAILGKQEEVCNKNVDLSKPKETYNVMSEGLKKFYETTYEKAKSSLEEYHSKLASMSECNMSEIEKITKELYVLNQDLSNMYEDLFGSVRCFIRMRPFNDAIDNEEDAKGVEFKIEDHIKVSMNCKGVAFKETEFYGAFDGESTNLDIYTGNDKSVFSVNGLRVTLKAGKELTDVNPWALYKTLKQLENGYSIVIGAYGLSGSGKSAILLGFEKQYGLVHYGLRNLDNVSKIELNQAFELYYSAVSPNDLSIQNRIILLHDKTGTFESDISHYGVNKSDVVREMVALGNDSLTDMERVGDWVKDVTAACQKNMRERGRIKTTPLNNQSSRSHLFLVFKIQFSNGTVSYFTLTDEAGIENAYQIYNKIFNRSISLPYLFRQFDQTGRYRGDMKRDIGAFLNVGAYNIVNGSDTLYKGSEGKLIFKEKTQLEDSLMKNVQILYESFSIVESLLHLKYFFNRRNGVDKPFSVQKIEKGDLQYDVNRVFKSPQFEDVFHPSYDKNRVSKVRCLMVPVLNYLDNLVKSKNKVTKFVMFTALRPDKCAENKDSLDFAASISMKKVKGD